MSDKYLSLREKNFAQLARLQEMIDEAIEAGEIQEIKNLTNAYKILQGSMSDADRNYQLAIITEGEVIPISAIDEYNKTFFPTLAKGIDELKLAIENSLPLEMVAEFNHSWQQNFKIWVNVCKEASQYITAGKLKEAGQNKAIEQLNTQTQNNTYIKTRTAKAMIEQTNKAKTKKKGKETKDNG